ncbi:MAG TPA: serine/threonine-protein kinase [Ktedonobacteraceae bacterium]|jgi:hypothetical protein
MQLRLGKIIYYKVQSCRYGIARFVESLRWPLIALEILFFLRFCFMLLGVDSSNPFVALLYTLTGFFLFPFEVPTPLVPAMALGRRGTHDFEWVTLIAMSLYALLFYFVKQTMYLIISRSRKLLQHMEEHEVHAAKRRQESNASSRRNAVQEFSLQSSGYVSYYAPYREHLKRTMARGPKQVVRKSTRADDITLPMAIAQEREISPVSYYIGEYALIRQLGRGGYARVYLGKHDDLGTRVALKLLDPLLTGDEAVKRFLFEAHVLSHLRHPHIVRMLNFGWDKDIPFIVMEYAPGGTLFDYFSPHLPLSIKTILPFVLQIASALQYIHNHGLIHCDVKPENILLGPNRKVWLSDFGIVQPTTAINGKQISTKELTGTPLYMAPERITGNPLPASDQYALALMIYLWLCGRGPFQGTTSQLCLQHLDVPPPRLRDHVPSISRSIERVVLKALAKNPQRRFAHVQAFAYALKQASCAE